MPKNVCRHAEWPQEMCRWGAAEDRTIWEKKDIIVVSSKACYFRFWQERGNFNLELPDQWYLLACGRMSCLSFVQNTFDCVEEMALAGDGEKGAGTGEQSPSK